ncbi:MAG: putative HTH-type transcriptional repressor ExuR [Pseudomonadota bacterium]|jgi:LacI family transcriptional regulator
MKSKVTIEDVAKAAGVGRQTVSRVINNGPNVKPALRQRVQSIIEDLGYSPNLSAKRMGGGRSYMILAINDRARTLENWHAGRGNDWVDQMLYGGMSECERHNYHLLFELIDTETQAALSQLSSAIGALRPDGVILTPPHSENEALVALLDKRGVPCARIGYHGDGSHVEVFMDEAKAAREVTEKLLELGHTRIGYIAGSSSYGTSVARIAGFRQAIASSCVSETAGFVSEGDFNFDTAAKAFAETLQQAARPTAIIADNDEMAFAVLHIADREGLRVPNDLSVVSFEDTPGVRFSVPPLSAVRQPTAAMIAKACEVLITAKAGNIPKGSFELPYTFHERASIGPRD